MTTAYGQPDKSLISCGFTRLDLFTSTCFCLSWCVAASVILGANGFWLRSILNPPQRKLIRLIINVEAQTAFNPGYPLTKRAIYYCSRMISAQHGPIFTNSEYGKIRKVYSIWVCTHALLRRTISYHDYREDFYHAFLAGIFTGAGYMVDSNKEHGEGRSDVVVYDSINARVAIFEAKYTKALENLESECDTALQQIDDRMYAKEYEDDYDQILCYGISFFKKRCMVKKK